MIVERFKELKKRRQAGVLAALIVVSGVTFIAAQIIKPVNDFITSTGVLTYLTLLVVLDLGYGVSKLLNDRTQLKVSPNQDSLIPDLLRAADVSVGLTADLLEYAGVSTAPLLRKLRDSNVKMRVLIRNPRSCGAYQRARTQSNLEALYGSLLVGYELQFEIRCYSAPFTLRGRRIGRKFLEVGWLTHDFARETAFGRANPSVTFDPSRDNGNPLIGLFDKTFEDLWTHSDTVDARTLLPSP